MNAELSELSQTGSHVWIRLLGPLRVTRDGAEVELRGPKRRALLTFLSLHVDTPVGREQIIEALWPRRRTGREDSTLRVHISHLRDELEPDREQDPKILVTRGQSYMLSGHLVETDIGRFDELVSEARRRAEEDPSVAVSLFDEALELWRGRPLQDVEYEDFAQDEIRRLDSARLAAIRDRAGALIAIGEDVSALQDLEPLARDDPGDEGAALLLMKALYRTGRQTEALRVGDRLRRHLRDLGLDPSPRVALLEEQIVNHDPTLLPEGTLAPGEIKPGRSVRGYELREEAGRGSIGVVYRAFQPAVGREVAVKVIAPELARSPSFVRRFVEEAKVIAGLEHPHIVPLHDFWREPNGAFLVMRWMDGGSMADRLSAHWGVGELGRVFDQVAGALGYAHGCGIVHRDVKPANILFDSEGSAYLCDFALAAAGVETGPGPATRRSLDPAYAAPELFRGEGPTVASDIYGLGMLLAEAASDGGLSGSAPEMPDSVWEVVSTATAANPADRYPDMSAFRLALREAAGAEPAPAPKTVRRNPFKGLEPFDEIDSADFYGRDDVVEHLLDAIADKALVALIGPSGSGKSSVVRAGLIPQLRDGALPGSDQWTVVTMVPGTDPFDEYALALRDAAIGPFDWTSDMRSGALRSTFLEALDGPNNRALLVIDQFEELFSSGVDEKVRSRFLDNLVDLATDPMGRFRMVVTMRADFSGRPLAHPTFGDMIADSSLLLAPMRPEELEEVIRRPAARVGVQVEPGLISEIIRDVADAPAYLPLLQYVLAELFERRSEDRLTVQAYRILGGVQGVLERRAEATFATLGEEARLACRQLFLRMVNLGDHGEETRRRLPLSEVTGLGSRAAAEAALDAFSSARLLTYDRDPVSRTPTVEVAHETVIDRWVRYRIWIDEVRNDLLAQRRISAAARTWEEAGEDTAYLLTGGPLGSALDVIDRQRVELNVLEKRFVEVSRESARAAEEREVERRQREADLEDRSRRRLGLGIGVAVIAMVIAALALTAWTQRQRATEIAAVQERQSRARKVAASALDRLSSGDSDLSLLLAIASAEETLNAGGEIVDEAVNALHHALINPRPELEIEGVSRELGRHVVDYSSEGDALATLSEDREVLIFDPDSGDEIGRIPGSRGLQPFGVAFRPASDRVLTIHEDAAREWDWPSGHLVREFGAGGGSAITTAEYSNDGSRLAIGYGDGLVRVYVTLSGRLLATLRDPDLEPPDGERPEVFSVDFDPTGSLLTSSTRDVTKDGKMLVWRVATGNIVSELPTEGAGVDLLAPIVQLAWQPVGPLIVGVTPYGETLAFNGYTGQRFTSYGNGNSPSEAVAIDDSGSFVFTADGDGVARAFGTYVGGEPFASLPSGGVPLRDLDVAPGASFQPEVATVSADGLLRIWADFLYTELPARPTQFIAPKLATTPDGNRYVISGSQFWYGLEGPPWLEVHDGETGQLLAKASTFATNQPPVPAMTADGSTVAYLGPDGDIETLEVETGSTRIVVPAEKIRYESPQFYTRGQPGVRLALSQDGSMLGWSGPDDGIIRIWDTKEQRQIVALEGHGDRTPPNSSRAEDRGLIERFVFRSGSQQLASAGHDGTLRVWDLASAEGEVFASFDYRAHSVAYSSDGSLLAVSDRTGFVQVLDADSGDVVLTPDRVSGPTWLRFSPDGRRLAGAGPGPFVHIWEMETGHLSRRLKGSIYWPWDVVFLDGGRKILVLSTEGVMRGYHLDPEALLEAARAEVDREMTEKECQQYLERPCDG